MFTGIVETQATLLEKDASGITLERPAIFTDVVIGSSISVSGVCLSIVELQVDRMRFDVIPETLRRTTLGSLTQGTKVNLERAMPANGRFEGHIVQGHVEAVGTVEERTSNQHDERLRIAVPQELHPWIAPKGSITIDGVSLTVAEFTNGVCTVALIPHTMEHTTLGTLTTQDHVNIETDILAKYVTARHA